MPENIVNFLSEKEKKQILNAIESAELNTSGEIRFHIENKLKGDLMDRAAFIFDKLGMQRTEERNGVQFYLAVKSRKFAILGDIGINKVVPDNFWDEIKDKMQVHFKNNEFAQGIVEGINIAGEKLKEFFPYQSDDKNELSDEISYGE
jgi:uncharacterized membrane protein